MPLFLIARPLKGSDVVWIWGMGFGRGGGWDRYTIYHYPISQYWSGGSGQIGPRQRCRVHCLSLYLFVSVLFGSCSNQARSSSNPEWRVEGDALMTEARKDRRKTGWGWVLGSVSSYHTHSPCPAPERGTSSL